jgi:hypothetical protein
MLLNTIFPCPALQKAFVENPKVQFSSQNSPSAFLPPMLLLVKSGAMPKSLHPHKNLLFCEPVSLFIF